MLLKIVEPHIGCSVETDHDLVYDCWIMILFVVIILNMIQGLGVVPAFNVVLASL